MPTKTYQLVTPPGAPAWFVAFQVQLAQALSDIAMQIASMQGQGGQESKVSGNLNVGGNRIINVGTPSAATDAATKAQVDDVASQLDTLDAIRGGDSIVVTRPKAGEVTITLRFPARVGPTGSPGAFSALYYVLAYDHAGQPCYIPAMAAPW